jgi:predicted small metal-binding protein
MTEDIERCTAEGLHEIADMPGENSYFADICSHDLSVWVCGVCSVDDCDWTGELVTEDSEALSELARHLRSEHGLFARIANCEEVA